MTVLCSCSGVILKTTRVKFLRFIHVVGLILLNLLSTLGIRPRFLVIQYTTLTTICETFNGSYGHKANNMHLYVYVFDIFEDLYMCTMFQTQKVTWGDVCQGEAYVLFYELRSEGKVREE